MANATQHRRAICEFASFVLRGLLALKFIHAALKHRKIITNRAFTDIMGKFRLINPQAARLLYRGLDVGRSSPALDVRLK